MTMFFSAAQGGFFDDALHRVLPPDAIELADEAYQALMAAQAEGKCIARVGDMAQAIDPPPPSTEDQLAVVRSRRNRLLDRTDKLVSVSDFPISAARRDEAIAWRALLRDVPAMLDAAAPFETVQWPPPPAWMNDRGDIVVAEEI